MLFTKTELDRFVASYHEDITETFLRDDVKVGYCQHCQEKLGLRVERTEYGLVQEPGGHVRRVSKEPEFRLITLSCPICQSTQRIWAYEIDERVYQLLSIPGTTFESIDELPETPAELRDAYGEALKCLEADAPAAAVLMLRVALHVILRHILGVGPATLNDELASVVGVKNALGITLSTDFSDNPFLQKDKSLLERDSSAEADALSFTMADALALHDIFQAIAFELWVEPKARRTARARMQKRHRPKTQTIG